MAVQKIVDERNKLRTEIKNTRKALCLEEWHGRSQRVFNQLSSSELFQNAKCVHCYLSSELQREVDTHPILSWMLDAGKAVCIPVVRGREMLTVHFDQHTEMVEGKFGVPEPVESKLADESQIDIVLVPLLVADKLGNRLGYGKGYYDRFFTRLSEEKIFPAKVGLAFDFQLVERIPVLKTDHHEDVPLNMLVTETRLITIG